MSFNPATACNADDAEQLRYWQFHQAANTSVIEPLTACEKRFLLLLADGASNRQIADAMSVTENTVKYHLKNVYSKFSVKSRVQAVNAAMQLGMLSPTPSVELSTPGAL